jgi:hypothetical protein
MRLEFVLGLLSTFQIYHQSLGNSLAAAAGWFYYDRVELSAVSAIFPLGECDAFGFKISVSIIQYKGGIHLGQLIGTLYVGKQFKKASTIPS